MKKLSEYTSKDGKFVHQAKAGRYGGSKPDVEKPMRAPKAQDIKDIEKDDKKPELSDHPFKFKKKTEGVDEKLVGNQHKIEDTKQLKTAIALAKSQKAIRQAKHGKDKKFYSDGTPVTPEEIARRAAERKAKKQGVAEGVDEKLVGNQHKIDANKDGKITSHDFKKLRKQKGETATMNPKMDNGKGDNSMEQKEAAVKSADKEPEAYTDPRTGKVKYRMVAKDRDMIKKESTIRQKLLSIFEKKDPHTTGAAAPETMDDKLTGAGAKKMKADLQGNAADPDLEKKSHDDASKAGRVGPNAKARPNDNAAGDKKVVNPVDDVTKKAGGSAEVKEESIMDKVLAYLRK